MNLMIVGGVAGRVSAAARALRFSEEAHIVLFERGPDVSSPTVGCLITSVGKLLSERNCSSRRRSDCGYDSISMCEQDRPSKRSIGISIAVDNRNKKTVRVPDLPLPQWESRCGLPVFVRS